MFVAIGMCGTSILVVSVCYSQYTMYNVFVMYYSSIRAIMLCSCLIVMA